MLAVCLGFISLKGRVTGWGSVGEEQVIFHPLVYSLSSVFCPPKATEVPLLFPALTSQGWQVEPKASSAPPPHTRGKQAEGHALEERCCPVKLKARF